MYTQFLNHIVRVQAAQYNCCHVLGKAKLRVFDFKTTWSEFQKPSQTATEQGKAELRILDFKTT